MKQSMSRIISERPRSRTGCVFCAAAGGRMRRQLVRDRISREIDAEAMPARSGRQADPKEYGARSNNLRPLERWLHGRIGGDWDEIWSEACGVADIRSHRGWKLRQHLELLVETVPLRISANHFRGFYVDPETHRLQYRPQG